MNAFLARLYTLCIKNKNKRKDIYNLLTNRHNANGGGGLIYDKLVKFENDSFQLRRDYANLNSILQEQREEKLKTLKTQIQNKQKIRVCFYMVADSEFVFKSLFEKMQNDSIFEPFILVIPDVARGEEHMFYEMDKVYKWASQRYDKVFKSYDEKTQSFLDFTDKMDLLATSQPYETMSEKIYSIKYAVLKQVLPIFMSYGMSSASWGRDFVTPLPDLSLCWKIFVDTQYQFDEYLSRPLKNIDNIFFTGYAKMDELAKFVPAKSKRKTIIIAPHHTISEEYNGALQLSNFLKYADFFLELYAKYPNIDFIFRPHPLLFVALADEKISQKYFWGREKINDYLSKTCSFANVKYQEGGDYFETFVNSSGIIHDCGSFTAEYLYTDNPCCYMLKNKDLNDKNFSSFGKEVLKHYYQAFNERDIVDFIDNVIIKGDDDKKSARVKFAKESVRINFPNVGDKILEILKEDLL